MGIIEIITLIGGVAFFLYGMNIMSTGLEKMSGGKLESILRKSTSNRFKALALGAGVTAVIQSSSAVTVMLVGFVNSGIMALEQTVGVIMGSNIGTTMTAWILTLTGIDGDSVWMKLLKPDCFSLIFALVGVIFIMGKNQRRKDVGEILLGFAILMLGMELMGDAVGVLKDTENPDVINTITSMLSVLKNPIVGVLFGAIFTAIIQSSSASVGILIALAGQLQGDPDLAITFEIALPIIMGQNIGTCISAVIASFGASSNAKRVSAVHILFNLIGTVFCLSVFYIANAIFEFEFIKNSIDEVGVAVVHTSFNIITTLLLIGFSRALVSLANKIIKDKKGEAQKATLLDERLLATPSVAVAHCRNLTVKMSQMAKETMLQSMDLLNNYDKELAKQISDGEGEIDRYEDELGTYLVKLAGNEITIKDSQSVSTMLHSIGNFERIGDHAVEILETAQELNDKKLSFSAEAQKEIKVLESAIREILDITFTAFETGDTALARKVEPLEQVIDRISSEMRSNHIIRLQAGTCTIELGFILSDLINGFERVSDHCSNIAVAMIEVAEGVFDTHKYLNDIKSGNDDRFRKDYEIYKVKYSINEPKP